MTTNFKTIDDISREFCPIFYLHPNEQHNPCSVPDLMRNCKFEYYGVPPTNLLTLPPRTEGPSYVIENSTLRAADTNEKLLALLGDFTGLSFKESPERKLVILNENIPMSTEVQAIFNDPFTYMKTTYFTVIYLLFYGYNGTLEPHVFDQEYATCLFQCKGFQYVNNKLEINTPSLFRIYLSSHGKGRWFNRDEFEYVNGRPSIYVAAEAHSMYTKPLVIRKFFGLGNDETAKGEVYDPINNVVVLADPRSSLAKVYYEANKLYYFNGLYEKQSSILFSERRTNILMYDGYYKTASTAELWEIKPFDKYKGLFITFFRVSFILIVLILIDNDSIGSLISQSVLVILTIICFFLFQWLYVS